MQWAHQKQGPVQVQQSQQFVETCKHEWMSVATYGHLPLPGQVAIAEVAQKKLVQIITLGTTW